MEQTRPPIDTGHKWFGRKILLESTGDSQIDKDLVALFTDEWDGSGPLEMSRPDVRRVLAHQGARGQNDTRAVEVLLVNEPAGKRTKDMTPVLFGEI